MALISRIRKHSWIIVAALAVALIGFLIMDVASNNSFSTQNKYSIGKVNGTNIDYNDFSRSEQILYSNSTSDPYARRSYLWNFFVEKVMLDKASSQLGLGISAPEMEELQFGNNLSPVISQRFLNPNTQTVDRDQLNQIKQGLEANTLRADLVDYWNEQKKEVIKDRLQSKYISLITKAIYAPTWMAEQRHIEQSEQVDFQYVKLPFDLIKDSLGISDSEIKAYINSHEATYKYPEESRFIDYVSFPITATAEDSAAIRNELANLVDSFRNTKEDSLFVLTNEGTFDKGYYTKTQLSSNVADILYAQTPGSVYGPYIDNTDYRIAKIVKRKTTPDSVMARHILRTVQTTDQVAGAQSLIDSLKQLLESGNAKFDSLAIRFSQDPGSGFNGGDLGMIAPDAMVKPFNDVIFFEAEKDKYYTVFTQFGIHLIQVTKQVYNKTSADKVQMAYLTRPIIPSQETQDRIEDEVTTMNNANRNLGDLKKAIASNPNLIIESTGGLKRNDAVAGLLPSGESSRSIVRWAFDKKTKVNDISPEIFIYEDAINFYTNQLVIAGLKLIQPKGMAQVNAVKDDITVILTNKKKGEALIKQIGAETDIYALATKYNSKVDSAAAVNFSTSFLPEMGNEPKVVAAAFGMEKNTTSKPFIGSAGVYVVKTVNRNSPIGEPDITFFREQSESVTKNNVTSFLMESIKKNAKIKDNRFTFF